MDVRAYLAAGTCIIDQIITRGWVNSDQGSAPPVNRLGTLVPVGARKASLDDIFSWGIWVLYR